MSQARRDLREATKGEKRLGCHLRGRRQQRVRQENAPLKQESQLPEQLGTGWPHGQYMALTGTSMLTGCDPAEPALTGNDVQTGQKVGRKTVSMAAEFMGWEW